MKKSLRRFKACAAALLFLPAIAGAFGTGNMPTVPTGWTLKETYTNVRIYKKDDSETYVQVMDIIGGLLPSSFLP